MSGDVPFAILATSAAVVVVTALAVVVWLGFRATGGGAVDLLDRSIGMYLLRRSLGRSTETRRERARTTRPGRANLVSPGSGPDGVRAGIGPVPRAPTRIVVAGDRVRLASAPRLGIDVPPTRLQLLRHTAMTLTGIAAVILVASAFWPSGPGEV